MTQRIALMAVLASTAIVAAVLLRRRGAEPEAAPTFRAPVTIDRSQFARPDAPWLVVVFTAHTCSGCGELTEKAMGLESPSVAVQEVEHSAEPELHKTYRISAVPLVVIADSDGRVRSHFFGPVNATDLWAATAEVQREDPGSG